MNRILLKGIPFFLGMLLLAHPASAHPGRTASDGGHYCRTNCASWGEVYGQRHFHGTYAAPARSTLDDITYDKLTFNLYHDSDYVFEYQGLTITLPSGQYPTLRQWEALRKSQEVASATTDTIILNTEVPRVVETIFTKVYDRKVTPSESTYWKKRARTDKNTVSALRGAMTYAYAHGYSIPSKKK